LGTVKPLVAFRHLDDSGSCSAGPLPYVAWGDSQIGQVIYWSCEMFIVRLILWKRLPQWRQCNLDVAQWVFKYKERNPSGTTSWAAPMQMIHWKVLSSAVANYLTKEELTLD